MIIRYSGIVRLYTCSFCRKFWKSFRISWLAIIGLHKAIKLDILAAKEDFNSSDIEIPERAPNLFANLGSTLTIGIDQRSVLQRDINELTWHSGRGSTRRPMEDFLTRKFPNLPWTSAMLVGVNPETLRDSSSFLLY